jgi:hypothetical protein
MAFQALHIPCLKAKLPKELRYSGSVLLRFRKLLMLNARVSAVSVVDLVVDAMMDYCIEVGAL